MAKQRLTKRGKDLLAWLRHWEISSMLAVKASGHPFTDAIAKQEKEVLAFFVRSVRQRYTKRG